jgi:hypothetical protein
MVDCRERCPSRACTSRTSLVCLSMATAAVRRRSCGTIWRVIPWSRQMLRKSTRRRSAPVDCGLGGCPPRRVSLTQSWRTKERAECWSQVARRSAISAVTGRVRCALRLVTNRRVPCVGSYWSGPIRSAVPERMARSEQNRIQSRRNGGEAWRMVSISSLAAVMLRGRMPVYCLIS